VFVFLSSSLIPPSHALLQDPSAGHGIIPRALHDVFTFRDGHPDRDITIACSYLELYNEKAHDLLNLEGRKFSGAGLEMREVCSRHSFMNRQFSYLYPIHGNLIVRHGLQLPTKEVVFPDASLVEISTFEDFTELLYQSSSLRAVATTNYNEYSSRRFDQYFRL
jgi:hypothetical protein